ncbi:hypothetical protein [Desulforhopalus singaporensis]|uniref:Cytoplasmic protein n=1 Tax=Desulforhopalus singaporensis TaxID=91360 RepID=A0A1H0JRH4_9BACT|nr:hypothetical protein [Desulforhopalus singaporensis]SDO46204.1 hypothetical protein SAMN05660330_00290 [Desulforhopalus singaporensis]
MKVDGAKICFGLTEELDRDSLVIFLQLAGRQELAQTLAARMSSEEIINFVDSFMDLLRQHLTEQEYHTLFLNENHPHHTPDQ